MTADLYHVDPVSRDAKQGVIACYHCDLCDTVTKQTTQHNTQYQTVSDAGTATTTKGTCNESTTWKRFRQAVR
jgi:hypothetical protein